MKKLICLLLAFTLVFTLCACGNDDVSDVGDSTNADNSPIIEKSFNGYKTGGYYTLGVYEQDNDTSNGAEEIEWLILDIQDSKALVVSRYVLDCQQYNEENDENVTWETCTLRTWLNNDFLNSAFSDEEIAKIQTVTVSEDKTSGLDTASGNSVQDKIFILSATEAEIYFATDAAREGVTSSYAYERGAWTGNTSEEGPCWWWLRAPNEQNRATHVTPWGNIETGGTDVIYRDRGVRPAMWIDLA